MIGGIYSFADYLVAVWVLVPLVVWLTVEFLGILQGFARLHARIMGEVPASAQEAAQRVTRGKEWDYASTRNARQDLRGGWHG